MLRTDRDGGRGKEGERWCGVVGSLTICLQTVSGEGLAWQAGSRSVTRGLDLVRCPNTCELLASPMGPGPVPGCGRASPRGPALLGLWVAQAVRFLSEDLLCDRQGAATVPGIRCLLGTTSCILILRWSVPAEGPVQCGTEGVAPWEPGQVPRE